jgi:hypothetical protein
MSPPRPASPRFRPLVAGGVALAVAALALCLLLISRLGSPGEVAVTVVNGTPYNVEVAVGKAGSARQVALGTVRRDSRTAFEGVIDHGPQWVFHFSYGGSDAATVSLDEETLRAAHFVVDVPAAVTERLGALGFVPSSRSQ